MEMAGEHHAVRDRREAPGELLRRIWGVMDIPEVFHPMRVDPRFDMGEEAPAHLQAGLQSAHEIEDGGPVSIPRLVAGIEAQGDVVVSPDALRPDVQELANRLFDPFPRIEHIAQDHEAFRPMLLEHSDGLLQSSGVLVDIGQNAEFHFDLPLSPRHRVTHRCRRTIQLSKRGRW